MPADFCTDTKSNPKSLRYAREPYKCRFGLGILLAWWTVDMKSINHRTSLRIKKGANAFSSSLTKRATVKKIVLNGGSVGAESPDEARVDPVHTDRDNPLSIPTKQIRAWGINE